MKLHHFEAAASDAVEADGWTLVRSVKHHDRDGLQLQFGRDDDDAKIRFIEVSGLELRVCTKAGDVHTLIKRKFADG